MQRAASKLQPFTK